MRTLFEIVEGAKDGHKPTHDECYYAMLALDGLRMFDHMELMTLRESAEKRSLALRVQTAYAESFRRSKTAFEVAPQAWLGRQVPDNPDYQRERDLAFKVARKAIGINLRGPREPVPPS
jgi:hypothetical protein